MTWPLVVLNTPHGPEKAIAPNLLSISRATDIPAFHAGWLRQRWEAGYCEWMNPFNAAQRQHVAFCNVRGIVFWSKYPGPLMPFLHDLDQRSVKYYFQFTLNDYENERLEPRLPPLEERLDLFRRVAAYGPTIWRYDPVIFGNGLGMSEHLARISSLLTELKIHACRLVFSFVDLNYKRARQALAGCHSGFRTPEPAERLAFARELAKLRDREAPELEIATCAEELDLNALNISHGRCVDPGLLEQLCAGQDAGRETQGTLFGARRTERNFASTRDRGQRPHCGCAVSKDIGNYRMACGHSCLYCYAGHGTRRKSGHRPE